MTEDPATEDVDLATTDGSTDRDASDDESPATDARGPAGGEGTAPEGPTSTGRGTAGADAEPDDPTVDDDVTDTDGATVDADDADTEPTDADDPRTDRPPEDVQKYARFKKVDGAQYDRVNSFLRDRTYVTAREWAIARLCADFRTDTGVEMTKIGENLPELVPFMTDTYTPQAVNQARTSFEEKVRKSGATFLYGAMSGFFTAEELDEMMYEVSEIAKFLLEVEGVDLSVDDELEAEERISSVMRDVREASAELRREDLTGETDAGEETDAEKTADD